MGNGGLQRDDHGIGQLTSQRRHEIRATHGQLVMAGPEIFTHKLDQIPAFRCTVAAISAILE